MTFKYKTKSAKQKLIKINELSNRLDLHNLYKNNHKFTYKNHKRNRLKD